MNVNIEAHVNALFSNAPGGIHVSEMKEELLANLNDKYDDLIQAGKHEDEAFALAISGIGDIDNLLKDFGEAPEYQPLEIAKNQKKRSVFISIGIALYVLSIAPFILYGRVGTFNIGTLIMCVIWAIGTGFVVFGNSISRVKYSKANNSFVEDYKEMIANDNDRKQLRNAITASIWSLVVVFYLAFSFITSWWHVSWIIFLVGACAQQLILIGFTKPEYRKYLWHGILWTVTAVLYFVSSFYFSAWAWSWMIFLMTAAIEQIVRLLILWKKMA